MHSDLIRERWDEEYRNGRYSGERPVDFVEDIAAALDKDTQKTGLYAGCGNGRNFIPLSKKGLYMRGIDVSQEAIDNLSKRHPEYSDRLQCADFRDLSGITFDYVISIQVFQHGTESEVRKYFEKASELLKPGGILFLRVNSASTTIYLAHTEVEENQYGGKTIRYEDGPKKDLNIHFFTQDELEECLDSANLKLASMIRELRYERSPPGTGTWSQLELVSQKVRE